MLAQKIITECHFDVKSCKCFRIERESQSKFEGSSWDEILPLVLVRLMMEKEGKDLVLQGFESRRGQIGAFKL